MIPTDAEIEQFIRESFEDNFEQLKFNSGHSLAPDVKDTARKQVLMYWKKLREIATSITDTEVKLNLPGQYSPGGREFGIEGVVDIIREEGRTVMYDLKTQDIEGVMAHLESYERQLNVYAHIWQNLRGEELDETAIIATQYIQEVDQALKNGDPQQLEAALAIWEPVLHIEINPEHLHEMVAAFGQTVDQIEDSCFAPPPAERLGQEQSHGQAFATRVCRNCDARFSCGAYRAYALGGGKRDSSTFKRYYEDFGEEEQLDNWRDAALGEPA